AAAAAAGFSLHFLRVVPPRPGSAWSGPARRKARGDRARPRIVRHRCAAVSKASRCPRAAHPAGRSRTGAPAGFLSGIDCPGDRRGEQVAESGVGEIAANRLRASRAGTTGEPAVKAARIAIAALLLLALGAARKYTSVRDDLMRQREAMGQAWQQVESVLEKRAELAPSLGDAIKTVAKDGNPLYRDIVEARTALLEGRSPIEKIQANERLNMALSRLLLLSENYP